MTRKNVIMIVFLLSLLYTYISWRKYKKNSFMISENITIDFDAIKSRENDMYKSWMEYLTKKYGTAWQQYENRIITQMNGAVDKYKKRKKKVLFIRIASTLASFIPVVGPAVAIGGQAAATAMDINAQNKLKKME